MDNKKQTERTREKITRKEALQKGGKYAAYTAATMMMILGSSKEAAAQSGASSPPNENKPDNAPERW